MDVCDATTTADLIQILENYLKKIRPEPTIRDQLDISYEIEGQSVVLNEVRPMWNKPSEIEVLPYAKCTYVKRKGIWKIFWMRADLKWHSYSPKPIVKKLKQFLDIVNEDEYACFKG